MPHPVVATKPLRGIATIAIIQPRVVHEPPAFDGVDVDLLRVRLEQELPLPAVIAITSATAQDGKELIARGLAHSYAMTGYSTLFIDTALACRMVPERPRAIAITDIGRQQSPADSGSGTLAVLTLNDITLHRTTSLRSMKAAFDILRAKFDCVVISTEAGTSNAFAAAILATADALLVTVKTGRRQAPDDLRLAIDLERMGSRFLGVVAVDPSVITANSAVDSPVRKRLAPGLTSRPMPVLVANIVRTVMTSLRGKLAMSSASRPQRALPQAAERRGRLEKPLVFSDR